MGCQGSKQSSKQGASGNGADSKGGFSTLEAKGASNRTRDSAQDVAVMDGSGAKAGFAGRDAKASTSSSQQTGGQQGPENSGMLPGRLMSSPEDDKAPAGAKTSMESGASSNTPAAPGAGGPPRASVMSNRSSFAVERDPDGTMAPGAARLCNINDRLQQRQSLSDVTPSGYTPAPELAKYYRALLAMPRDMPAPLVMLQKLWQLPSSADAGAIAEAFKAQGVMRVAALDDGSAWCLVAPEHLANIRQKFSSGEEELHNQLLDAYTMVGGNEIPLKDVPDDGYIVQNIAHHLIGAARIAALRDLLGEPGWLEGKLHAYGVAACVQDFRRYLGVAPGDAQAKLLLQAFQLSLSCCMEHPAEKMLREQMLGRLVTVAQSSDPAFNPTDQSGANALMGTRTSAEMAAEMSTASNITSSATNIVAPNNKRSGSLAEGGGRGSMVVALAGLKRWFEGQLSKVSADMCMAAGYSLVHLVPRTGSLVQAGGVERMVLRGHTGPLRKVVISPNGQDVITVSEDGTAQVWDMNVGDCVMQLARDQPLTGLDVAPGGHLCAVGSEDGHCCIWDLANGQVRHVLKGHTGKVNAVAIDRQGIRCVTAGSDHTVRVWSMQDGSCEQVLAGHGTDAASALPLGAVFDVAISSDGTLAATASEDFSARVWDLDEECCAHVLEGHSGWVVSVSFIGSTSDLITASHDGTARVWDGERGRCMHVLKGHTGRLNRVCCDPGGRYAVTCSDDNTARVWDLDDGKCLSVLEGHSAWVNDAAITRDGKVAVTVGGDCVGRVWDVAKGVVTCVLEGHSDNIRSVALSAKGRFAITASDDNTARVWDLSATARQAQAKRELHEGRVRALTALPGGQKVVSCSDDGAVFVWDAPTGGVVHRLEGHKTGVAYMSVTRAGQVVSGSGDRRVCLWDPLQGKRLQLLPDQQGSRVKHMAFSADGSSAAVVLFDSSVAVWELATGTLRAQLIQRGERVGRNVHTGGVNGALLSANASLAVTWSKDCTARVWDVARNEVVVVVSGHTDGIGTAALSGDETMLATGSYGRVVHINRMADGAPLAILDHEGPSTQLLFAPSDRYLAVVLENKQVVVWDLVAKSCLPPLMAHKADVTAAAFSPDAALLATASQDCTVRVFDCATGRQVAFFMADAALSAVAFAGGDAGASKGGPALADILVVGDMNGNCHFLDFPTELHPCNAPSY